MVCAQIEGDKAKSESHIGCPVRQATTNKLIVQNFNENQKLLLEKEFTYDEVQENGAVLSEASGREVIVIEELSFDPALGGSVLIDYLSSGISGDREDFEIGIRKNDEERWELYDLDGKDSVTHIHFKARKLFGKTIGIKKVELK